MVIKPKQGNAIFYYNHEISPYTGWLGEMEPKVLSGITLVTKGVLWSAKMWINIIGDGVNELRGWRSGSNFLSAHNLNQALIEKMRNDFFREGERYLHYYKKSYKRTEDESIFVLEKSKLNVNKTQTTAQNDDKDLSIQEKIGIMKKYAEENNATPVESTNSINDSTIKKVFKSDIKTCENSSLSKETSSFSSIALSKDLLTEPMKPDPLPILEKLNIINNKKEQDLPLGPPKRTIDPNPYHGGKIIENRLVKASLILLEELERDELEIIARTIHDKLQLACIPLIINPIGN